MTDAMRRELWKIFKGLELMALTLSHYDLARLPESMDNDFGPDVWKQFIMEPEVQEWLRSESKVMQTNELNKALNGISKTRSVGQGQILNALAKLSQETVEKSGPIFIYTYVPLNPEQEYAPNVQKLPFDPFLKEATPT